MEPSRDVKVARLNSRNCCKLVRIIATVNHEFCYVRLRARRKHEIQKNQSRTLYLGTFGDVSSVEKTSVGSEFKDIEQLALKMLFKLFI